MMALGEAQQNALEAQAQVDAATEQLLTACQRQLAVGLALRHGLLPADAISTAIATALSQASLQLWQARQALQTASEALARATKEAAQVGKPSDLDAALAWVADHHPDLYQRYARDLANDQAADGDGKAKTRHILHFSRQDVIRAFQRSRQEVTAS